MFHSADGFLTCVHPWGRENRFCGCRLAEISFNGEENLLAGGRGVNSKILVQNKRQIFAEDAGRNSSKPRPGGLFGTLRGLRSPGSENTSSRNFHTSRTGNAKA